MLSVTTLLLAVPAIGRAEPSAAVDRAFTVEAAASPVELIVGRNETDLGGRFFATRAQAANPPRQAYGRAALVDLGFAESVRGPQGPNAEADTQVPNLGDDAKVRAGLASFEAHVDRAPRSETSATGAGWSHDDLRTGSIRSRSTAEASSGSLLASVESAVSDLSLGELRIGSAAFRAEARTTGEPGGAAIDAVVTLSDASFAGIPVAITHHGIAVDETRVPAGQATLAAHALTDALSSSPYAELRLVQPIVQVAADGTSATAHGGGLFARLTNATPGDSYFAELRLVGGEVEVFAGASLAADPPVPAALADAGAPGAAASPASGTGPRRAAGVDVPAAAPGEPSNAAGHRVQTDDRTLRLAASWSGLSIALGALWGAALLAGVLLWLPGAAGIRASVLRRADRIAVRYWRG